MDILDAEAKCVTLMPYNIQDSGVNYQAAPPRDGLDCNSCCLRCLIGHTFILTLQIFITFEKSAHDLKHCSKHDLT